MVYRQAIDATSYLFNDLRDLLAKATPPRSGDRLAGIAADSAEQMIAARMALANVPLKQFLNETVVPYEDDEVTRLIGIKTDAQSGSDSGSKKMPGDDPLSRHHRPLRADERAPAAQSPL